MCGSSILAGIRSSLIIALLEFHRTQCYFALVINIASIVSMMTGRLQPKTLGQATANFTFVAAMAQNNLFCLAFLFWYLRHNLQRSFYDLLLTWSSFIVALTASTIANSLFHVFGAIGLTPDLTYEACGFANPTIPCYGSSYVSIPFRSLSYANQFTYPIGVLAAEVFWCQLVNTTLMLLCLGEDYESDMSGWVRRKLAHHNKATNKLTELRQRYTGSLTLQFVLKLLYGVSKVILIAGTLEYMVLNLVILISFATSYQINMSSWSFGQIVAVTVWAPPIGKFVQSFPRK